jgi:hypothetical protein
MKQVFRKGTILAPKTLSLDVISLIRTVLCMLQKPLLLCPCLGHFVRHHRHGCPSAQQSPPGPVHTCHVICHHVTGHVMSRLKCSSFLTRVSRVGLWETFFAPRCFTYPGRYRSLPADWRRCRRLQCAIRLAVDSYSGDISTKGSTRRTSMPCPQPPNSASSGQWEAALLLATSRPTGSCLASLSAR